MAISGLTFPLYQSDSVMPEPVPTPLTVRRSAPIFPPDGTFTTIRRFPRIAGKAAGRLSRGRRGGSWPETGSAGRYLGTARRAAASAARHAEPADVHAVPAAAAGEIGGRAPPADRLAVRTAGRPAAGHHRARRGRQAGRARPGAARGHRLGQDLHHGPCHRSRRSDRRSFSRPTRRWRPSSMASSEAFFRTMQSNISSPTMITISRKPMCRAPTPISRRNPRSTSRSTGCGIRQPGRCSSATM